MALEHTFEQLLPQRPTCPFTAVSAAWAAPSTSGTSDITRKLNCRLPRQPRSPQQTARSRAIAPACRLRRDQREARSGRSYLKTAHQALGQPWPTTMMYVRLLPPPPRHTQLHTAADPYVRCIDKTSPYTVHTGRRRWCAHRVFLHPCTVQRTYLYGGRVLPPSPPCTLAVHAAHSLPAW